MAKETVTMSIDSELMEEVKSAAKADNRSISNFIEVVLAKFLAKAEN